MRLFLKAEDRKIQTVRVTVKSSGYLDQSAVMKAIENKVRWCYVILISLICNSCFYGNFKIWVSRFHNSLVCFCHFIIYVLILLTDNWTSADWSRSLITDMKSALQVNQILSDQGMNTESWRVTWRVHPDGKIFHQTNTTQNTPTAWEDSRETSEAY